MPRLLLIGCVFALSAPSLADEAPTALCTNTQFESPSDDNQTLPDGEISLESGAGTLTLGGDVVLSEGVSASRGDFKIEANEGRYSKDSGSLSLFGDITYQGAGADISSQEALLSYLYGNVEFRDAVFRLGNGASRGAAGLLRINRQGTIRLEDVEYTSCPPGDDDWLVSAKKIRLDTKDGVGEASGLSLRFKGVPILYTPYLSFPISPQRKTGFLLPNVGQSARNGVDISTPWYWNIAPAYDATLTPRILSRRGVQLDTTVRYLTPTSRGNLQVAHLPSDDILNIDRTLFRWDNTSDFADRWRAFADVTDVSDNEYLEDLGGSLSSASATHLNRSIGLAYRGPSVQADARVTHYQTIDSLIGAADVPYQLLPGMRLRGRWDGLPYGFEFQIDSDLTAFDRDVGTTGQRYHIAPGFAWSFEHSGFYVRPQVNWQYTQYQLDNIEAGADDSITRSLPTATLDAGVRFERMLSGGQIRQTLEPHVYYVHVPFRDQSAIPVFDTIQPISSLEQLYRANRFIGLDRIGDTDQITVGITSRLLETDSGKTILAATIGQSRYLSEQAVTLPGSESFEGNSSDYIAELRMNVWGNWNVDFAQQWNSQRNETSKSEIRLQYLPGGRRVVNLAYRFRRDSVDQGDISWSWPIASRWNMVGRYNYSFREKTSLERFVGLEYESCCWGVRIVSRRYISRRDGTADTAIAIQLELKGLTSVGDPADRLLERGILGYRPE
ncbi:MAG: LPS assembly protein LptD [Pseudomonadota bacterium]